MLLRAERIISRGDILVNASEQDLFQKVRYDLSKDLVFSMIDKGLVKVEMVQEDEGLHPIVKVRASTRAYNPDD